MIKKFKHLIVLLIVVICLFALTGCDGLINSHKIQISSMYESDKSVTLKVSSVRYDPSGLKRGRAWYYTKLNSEEKILEELQQNNAQLHTVANFKFVTFPDINGAFYLETGKSNRSDYKYYVEITNMGMYFRFREEEYFDFPFPYIVCGIDFEPSTFIQGEPCEVNINALLDILQFMQSNSGYTYNVIIEDDSIYLNFNNHTLSFIYNSNKLQLLNVE